MAVQCYVNGFIAVPDKPCAGTRSPAGFYSCCGPEDVCLNDGLCRFTHPEAGATGYYTQSCTDRSFSDSACNQQCVNQLTDNVVYDSATNLWACCGNDAKSVPTCSTPTNYTFQAPSPESLLAQTIAFATLLSSSSSSASSTPSDIPTTSGSTSEHTSLASTTSPSPSTAPLQPDTSTNSSSTSSSGGLGSGAQAGIGVGVAIGALILLGALYLLFHWIMKTRGYSKASAQSRDQRIGRYDNNANENKGSPLGDVGYYPARKEDIRRKLGFQPAELPIDRGAEEMEAQREHGELP